MNLCYKHGSRRLSSETNSLFCKEKRNYTGGFTRSPRTLQKKRPLRQWRLHQHHLRTLSPVCKCVCMSVCLCVRENVCVCVHVRVGVHVYMRACVHEWVLVCLCVCICKHKRVAHLCVCHSVCMSLCVCACHLAFLLVLACGCKDYLYVP